MQPRGMTGNTCNRGNESQGQEGLEGKEWSGEAITDSRVKTEKNKKTRKLDWTKSLIIFQEVGTIFLKQFFTTGFAHY